MAFSLVIRVKVERDGKSREAERGRRGSTPEADAMDSKVAKRLKVARAAARGVTLIEVLIVVAIMSLISAGVTVAVLPKWRQAQVDTATTNARAIRDAVNRWRATRGGTDCPTISQLLQDKEIDASSKTDDPWGGAFKIQCTEDDSIVSSPGPDKKENTKDDIQVPKKGGES